MAKEYKGESPSKTVARQLIWEQIIKKVGQNKIHLVLSGPDAGDVRLVCAIHKPRYVIGIDRDVEALKKANKQISKEYQAALYHEDITDFDWPEKFDSIFLDWCGNINRSSVTKTFMVAQKHLADDGVLGVGFCAAREVGISFQFNKFYNSDHQRIDLFSRFARNKGLYLFWSCSYNSGHTPMVYMLFSRQPLPVGAPIYRVKATRQEIEERAKFAMKTKTTREIEDVYCLPRYTAAGWKAAETRKAKSNGKIT